MLDKIKTMLSNDRGEAYVGEAVKIVIAVVIGAALLAGLALLFNSVVLPKTKTFVEDLFTQANTFVTTLPAMAPEQS